MSEYRLQIFLVKYEYLRSLQLCKDQGIRGKLKKRVPEHVLRSLELKWRPGFKKIHKMFATVKKNVPPNLVLSIIAIAEINA